MNLPDTLNHFTDCKSSQLKIIAELTRERKTNKYATKLENCSTYLGLRHWYDHDKVTITQANFCKQHYLCRACAIRRAAKYGEQYEKAIKQWIFDHDRKVWHYMVTVTIKNREDIHEALNHLLLNWRAWWKHSRDQRRRGRAKDFDNQLATVEAGVVSLEVKRGQNLNLWHPHLHIYVISSAPLNKWQLRKQWFRFTGDSSQVELSKIEDVRAGLVEVIKYITKFSEMSPDQVVEIWKACRNKRMLWPVGSLRGLEISESLLDEDLDGPYRDYVAIFSRIRGGYSLYDSLENIPEG